MGDVLALARALEIQKLTLAEERMASGAKPRAATAMSGIRIPWITVEEWCQRTGDSRDAIYTRRQRGVWRDGVECSKPPGGGLWVNVEKASAWCAKSESPKASRSDTTKVA